MLQEGDRRHYARRTFHDAAQAFHDGHHVEGVPDDISVGGMFLRTPAVDEVHADEILGVLLDEQAGFTPPLFLFARVARVRRGAEPGLGLRWERAGSTGTPDDLANALELLFAIPASNFVPAITSSTGRLRTTYVFPHRSDAEPGSNGDRGASGPTPQLTVRRLAPEAPGQRLGRPGSGPIGLSVTDEELDQLDVKVRYDSQSRAGRNFKRAFDVDAGTVEATPLADGRLPSSNDDDDDEERSPRGHGGSRAASIAHGNGQGNGNGRGHDTSPVPRDRSTRRVPVHLEAVMTAAHVDVPVVVTGLGTTSLFVESPLAPLDRAARVSLVLDVRLRDGVRQFGLDCRLDKIHEGEYGTPPGVELTIVAFDVPQQRDEFTRLVEAARHAHR
jgi:hypothetical protein